MNPAGYDRDNPFIDAALHADEAKRAKEPSPESEHWLRSVVRSTSDVIMVLDADGSARYVNTVVERILGYKAEELIGVKAFGFVHPEDAERAKQTFSKALRSLGGQILVEFRLRHADGSWRHVEVVHNNLLDDPSVGGIVSNIRDVTERKQAEEALMESERRFRQLFEHSVDALLVIHDETREIVDCNKEACRSLGYSREELFALRLDDFAFEILSEEEKKQRGSNTPWRRALAGEPGTIIGFHENEHRRKDGTTFPVEVGVGSIDYEGRRMILASVRDITERKRSEEALRRSEANLTEAQRIARLGSSEWDLKTGEVWWSDEAYRIYGFETRRFSPTLETVAEVFHPDDRHLFRTIIEDAFREAKSYDFEHRIVRPDGEVRWLHRRGEVVRGQEVEETLRIVWTIHDITVHKRAEEELRFSKERLRGLSDAALEGLVITDRGMILEANQALLDILRCSPREVVGRSVLEYVAPEYRDQVSQNILSKYEEPYEIVGLRKDGTRLDLEVRGKAFSYQGQPVRVTAVRDITERKALERRLRHQALHDLLTGLPNRAVFMARLSSTLAHPRRQRTGVAVMFVDLDNFKFVNDTLGHHVGDELLVAASKRLRTCLRVEDTLVRLGGDEFAVLLKDLADEGEATRIAARIAEELRVPFSLDNQEVFVTSSIGIALNGSGKDSPEDLLKNADIAMYWAKKEGKARYQLFNPSMEAQSTERMRLEHDLRRALEQDAFRLYYQPLVRADSGRIMGMEALMRWEHPVRGLMLPDQFVPFAEETGLIIPLGKWALREACRQAKEWQERYPSDPPLIVGVNLSARQLEHPNIVDEVEEALRDSGLDPRSLTLEVTESVVVKDEEHNIDAMQRLEAIGIRFALDDFGTGYSALAYLRRLPVGLLKLDRSFLERLGEDAEAEVLLSGVISIASGLGLYVLTEGVETPEQLAQVKALGCDLVQGNYLSEPLPSEAATEILEVYNPSASLGSS